MSYQLVKNGGIIHVVPYSSNDVVDELEPAIYRVVLRDEAVSLVPIKERFKVPEKIRGVNKEQLNVLKKHHDTTGKVTALFIGLKGSGKTMTSEAFCNYLIDKNIPVFLVDGQVKPSVLRVAIDSCVDNKCGIMFDEFDSTYTDDKDSDGVTQYDMLSLFSDSAYTKVSFLITGNDINDFVSPMLNRPGRFMYRFMYNDVSSDMVAELCNAYNVKGEVMWTIGQYCRENRISFDSLNTIVQAASGTSTVPEMMEKIKWLNLPNDLFTRPLLRSIRSVNDTPGEFAASVYYNSDKSEERYRLVITHNGDIIHNNIYSFDALIDDLYVDVPGDKIFINIRPGFGSVSLYEDRTNRCLDTVTLMHIAKEKKETESKSVGSKVDGQVDERVKFKINWDDISYPVTGPAAIRVDMKDDTKRLVGRGITK